MTFRRSRQGRNKTEDIERKDAQIGFVDALRQVFPTTVVSHLAFRARICRNPLCGRSSVTFDLRQCAAGPIVVNHLDTT